MLLGGRRLTAARVVDVEEPLLEAVVRVRAAVPDLPRQGWLPHVTLARFKYVHAGRVQEFIEANALFRAPPFPVDHFSLIASYLTKSGPIYEDQADYKLQ